MTTTPVISSLPTAMSILAAMALVAVVERVAPLHARERWYRRHVAPNLVLTFVTFGTSVVCNVALVTTLVMLETAHVGFLQLVGLPPRAVATVAVVTLDLSSYVAHRAMHASPRLWRYHAVHHCDPAVDVTTTMRQHPGETVIRYGVMAAFAIVLGTPPLAFAVYRVWSALHGLLEHANIRVPRRLDTLCSAVVATPNMHKVHHSRRVAETDSNYGNLFSIFDRLCGTFTPSALGTRVAYGLDGFDDDGLQSSGRLLALPFRHARVRHAE